MTMFSDSSCLLKSCMTFCAAFWSVSWNVASDCSSSLMVILRRMRTYSFSMPPSENFLISSNLSATTAVMPFMKSMKPFLMV